LSDSLQAAGLFIAFFYNLLAVALSIDLLGEFSHKSIQIGEITKRYEKK